jgi:hypothetical protein
VDRVKLDAPAVLNTYRAWVLMGKQSAGRVDPTLCVEWPAGHAVHAAAVLLADA